MRQALWFTVLSIGVLAVTAGYASPLPPGAVCSGRFQVVSCETKTSHHPLYGDSQYQACVVEALDEPVLVGASLNGAGCPFKKTDLVKEVLVEAKPGEVLAGTLEWGGDEGSAGYFFTATAPIKQ
ncbi:MAG: hypothetical protein HQL20_06590 [Candidatus Omnitrophica bacterium]|nr:hypothetical protein [Candidatus Omnitrophota bacterium]